MKKIEKTEYPEKMYCKLISELMECLYGACSNIAYPDEDCVEYVRFDIYERERKLAEAHEQTLKDMQPQWQPIPTDKDGFGDWEETFEKANIIAYHDGTIYGQPDFDGELGGDIERHPDRFRWMRVDNPFENKEQ